LKDYPEVSYAIDEFGDFFRVKLNIAPLPEKDLEKDLQNRYGLTDNQMKILTEVERDGAITQQRLSELIGITPKNVRINMEKLKAKGLLERIGPDKGGRWQVIARGH
jgi:ATP-dependent DNA helicase RecG